MKPIRVLIADDHALFVDGLRALLEDTPDIEVAADAADGKEAIRLAAEIQPDVVLMDINMPGVNGIRATREMLRTLPDLGVVMVTMVEEGASVFAAMRAGARGYVLKGRRHDEMLETIRAVAEGQVLFGPEVAARLTNYFQNLRQSTPEEIAGQAFPELTPREREVLALLAQGLKNDRIARELVISPKTVRNHVSNIYSKLQVADRTEAVLRAREAGLGEEET